MRDVNYPTSDLFNKPDLAYLLSGNYLVRIQIFPGCDLIDILEIQIVDLDAKCRGLDEPCVVSVSSLSCNCCLSVSYNNCWLSLLSGSSWLSQSV